MSNRMNEVILCQCLWPAKIYKTITGHEPTCPVEKAALADRKVEFLKVLEEKV